MIQDLFKQIIFLQNDGMFEDSGSAWRPQSLWTLQEVPEVMQSPELGRCLYILIQNKESLSHLGSRCSRYKLY